MLSLAHRTATSAARPSPTGKQAFATSVGRAAKESNAFRLSSRPASQSRTSEASLRRVSSPSAPAIVGQGLLKYQLGPKSSPSPAPAGKVGAAAASGVLQYAYPEKKASGAESARSARAAAFKGELQVPPLKTVKPSASGGGAKIPKRPALSFVHPIKLPSTKPSSKSLDKDTRRLKAIERAVDRKAARVSLVKTASLDQRPRAADGQSAAKAGQTAPNLKAELWTVQDGSKGGSSGALEAALLAGDVAVEAAQAAIRQARRVVDVARKEAAAAATAPISAPSDEAQPTALNLSRRPSPPGELSDKASALSAATLERRALFKKLEKPGVGQASTSDQRKQNLWRGELDGARAHRALELVTPEAGRPPVARLAHSLDRALFNPGVHLMRDPRTDTYNFDERLRILPDPKEIDLKRLPPYVTASKDTDLAQLAEDHKCRFFGSTSTLTSSLAHIWYLLGGWKRLDLTSLTLGWKDSLATFSAGTKKPAAIYLRYDAERDMYGVDNDKTGEPPGEQRILQNLGKVMEKMLTTSVADFERFRKSAPAEAVSQEERTQREAYNYRKGRSLLMRSQLDGHDARLPGGGIFDVKTRATASVRFDIENHEEGRHYQMSDLTGVGPSFERERYDMMRSAWLKYGLQCRIGGMDGIFCAYHSTRYLQGFEYIPLEAMDQVIYGSAATGDRSFGLSVRLLERIFECATKVYPKESLHIIMHTSEGATTQNGMSVVVQPMRDDVPEKEMPTASFKVHVESFVKGKPVEGELPKMSADDSWTIQANIIRHIEQGDPAIARGVFRYLQRKSLAFFNSGWPLPTGKTEEEMQELFRQRWEAEVNEADGEFASFAWRRATPKEARAALEAERAEADGDPSTDPVEITYPLPLVRASPPKVTFPRPSAQVKALRGLSRRFRLKEEAQQASRKGRPVIYFQQQPTPLPTEPSPL